MTEELDDGEFWLPPEFLTDDDILMDFPTVNESEPDSSSGTRSDRFVESDEDELFSVFIHQFGRSSIGVCDVPSKVSVLSSSPKSTLCGCGGKDGSSLGSPNRLLSPPLAAADPTWDLLNKAAGEVEKVKVRRENKATTNSGTGFFDCSVKAPLRNHPHPKINNFNHPSLYSHPQFQPLPQGLVWGQVQAVNGPLRLPPSAWPPLPALNQQQGQSHQHHGMAPVFMGQPELKRGTGVFLPRHAPLLSDTRKESDGNEKVKNGKGQSKQRKGLRSSTANQSRIKLPKEWTY